MTYRIKLDNIQKSVDEEMRHIEDDEGEFTFRFDGGPTDSRSEFNLFNYHPLEKIYDFVTQVNHLLFSNCNHAHDQFPNTCRVRTLKREPGPRERILVREH